MSTQRETALHDPAVALKAAILAGDTDGAAALLETFPALKERLNEPLPDYSFGGTPLLAAVQRSNRGMIDLLLRSGADINGRSHWWAGGFGVLDADHGLTDFLIARGACVDAHAAARLGMLDQLRELVAADPGVVAARGGDGQTPLHFAGTVAALLQAGAKPPSQISRRCARFGGDGPTRQRLENIGAVGGQNTAAG